MDRIEEEILDKELPVQSQGIKVKLQSFFKDGHIRDIAKWASISFIIKISAAGFQFLFNVLLSRTLGASEVGKYFLCFSIVNIAVMLGILGIDKAIMRFVPIYAAKKDWSTVRKVFNLGAKISLLSGVLVSVLLYLGSDLLAKEILDRPNLGEPIRWFILTIIPLMFLGSLTEAFKGLKRIPMSLAMKSFLPALAIIGVLTIVPEFGLIGMIWTYDVAVCIMAVVGILFWYFSNEKIYQNNEEPTEDFEAKDLMKSSMPLFGLSLFQQIIIWAPTFLLAFWVEDAQIGQFAIAQRVAIITSLFLIAFNTILTSKIGQFIAKGQKDLLEKTTQRATLLVLLLVLPVFLFLIIFANFTMSIFGNDFTGGGTLLQVLLIGKLIGVMLGPVGLILIVGGREKLMRNTMMVSAITIVGLNIILVPLIGTIGAAIASTTAIILQNILAAILVYREFKIITLPIFLLKRK